MIPALRNFGTRARVRIEPDDDDDDDDDDAYDDDKDDYDDDGDDDGNDDDDRTFVLCTRGRFDHSMQKGCEVRRLLDSQQSVNCRCQSERHAPLRHSCICENRLGEARKSSFVPQQGVNRRCLLFSITVEPM